MNEIAVLESDGTEPAQPLRTLSGGYELFGLGWRPPAASEYVGRHRSPDA